jgi:hypothetical protein
MTHLRTKRIGTGKTIDLYSRGGKDRVLMGNHQVGCDGKLYSGVILRKKEGKEKSKIDRDLRCRR